MTCHGIIALMANGNCVWKFLCFVFNLISYMVNISTYLFIYLSIGHIDKGYYKSLKGTETKLYENRCLIGLL